MKISREWLSDFLDLEAAGLGVSELTEGLERLGFALEGLSEVEGDDIFDLEIPSNRPDCLSHLGIARELGASFQIPLKPTGLEEMGQEAEPEVPPVHILDPDLCPRYCARVIEDVQVGSSPQWLQTRLRSLGQRPVNNVVDVTNFVMLHVGQPTHAFDFKTLEGGQIVVRRARRGEVLKTLDGVERPLEQEMLAICDAEKPVAVAGVMGGLDTEVTLGTSTILLESAYFTPLQVRRTARALGLSTEASYRFERGSDPSLPPAALSLVSRLIEKVCPSARASDGPVDALVGNLETPPITLRPQRIRQVTGAEISPRKVEEILRSLDFQVSEKADGWIVTPPGFRGDIRIEDDLVEEVLRHFGYDQIEARGPGHRGLGSFLPDRVREERVIGALTGAGFSEAVNLAFTTPERAQGFLDEMVSLVPVENPLSEEHTHLRASLLPGLFTSVQHNLARGASRVRLFEMGKVFRLEEDGIREELVLGLVATGRSRAPHWSEPETDRGHLTDFSIFHLKGVVSAIVRQLGREPQYSREEQPFLQNGQALSLSVEGRKIGVLGELAHSLRDPLRTTSSLQVAQLSLDLLYPKELSNRLFQELPTQPSVTSDLSFVVDTGLDFDRMTKAVQELNIPDLREIHLIDLYRGPRLPSGRVSLTIRLTFENLERTLTQDEANEFSRQVFAELQERFGVEARS